MSLGSQGLTDNEKRIFRKIVRAAETAGTKPALEKHLGRISKRVVKKSTTASSRIAAAVREEIIDPFRRRNPER
jgi:hypothetical protein